MKRSYGQWEEMADTGVTAKREQRARGGCEAGEGYGGCDEEFSPRPGRVGSP